MYNEALYSCNVVKSVIHDKAYTPGAKDENKEYIIVKN